MLPLCYQVDWKTYYEQVFIVMLDKSETTVYIIYMIKDKIKRLRKKLGLSQEELAKRADLHWTTIGKIEAGMRVPELSTRKKLAKALNIDITELLD